VSARQLALIFALAVAEASLLTPVSALLGQIDPAREYAPAMWVMAAALGLTALLRRALALARPGFSPGLQRGVMALWLGLLWLAGFALAGARPLVARFAVGFTPTFAPALLAIVILWRGSTIGAREQSPPVIGQRFQISLLLATLLALSLAFEPRVGTLGGIALFFLAWLIALQLSHLEDTQASPVGRSVPMTRRWWLSLGATAFGAWLLAVIVAALATGQSLREVVGLLLLAASLPLAILLSFIPEAFFAWLRDRLANMQLLPPGFLQNSPLSGLFDQWQGGAAAAADPAAFDRTAALVIIAIAVLIMLVSLETRRRQTAHNNDRAADWSAALPPTPAATAVAQRLLRTLDLRQWLAAMTVRRLYARATREAAKRGAARWASQTPLDFLPRLREAFPHAVAEVGMLTDAYIAAHYGEVPDTREALDALRAAWERMRASQK
jgi:Domain of unknown function (DUF4129)